MNKQTINKIFERLLLNNPHPKIELNYNSTFELLIAVILSAQATDVIVNKVTQNLFKNASTPKDFLNMGLDKLKEHIKSIGLFNTKALNIIKTCKILVENYKSQVPSNREDLQNLPGVGRKTANIILNVAFGVPCIAVDTHVFRVANRTHLACQKTTLGVEEELTKNLDAKFLNYATRLLVLHGRYTCIARTPKCDKCIINDLCEYENKS